MEKLKFYTVPTELIKIMGTKERLLIKMYNGWKMMKNEDGYYFRSLRKLMEDCGTKNFNTVVNALKEFEEEGLIETRKGQGKTTYFKFTQKAVEGDIKTDSTSDIKSDSSSDIKVDSIYKNNKEKNNNNNLLVSKEHSTKEEDKRVEDFDGLDNDVYSLLRTDISRKIDKIVEEGMNPNDYREELFKSLMSVKQPSGDKYKLYYKEFLRAFNDEYLNFNKKMKRGQRYELPQDDGGDMVREDVKGGIYG